MNADGTYDQRRPADDEPVVCTQDVLMNRTRAAHERGADRGIVPAHPAVETTLLVDGTTDGVDAATERASPSTDGAGAGDARSATDRSGAADGESSAAGDGEAGSISDGGSTPDAAGEADLPPALVEHPGRWYVPDSDHYGFAVRTPSGGRDYRKTATAAATLVEQYWG
jgi:polyphosphate kinase